MITGKRPQPALLLSVLLAGCAFGQQQMERDSHSQIGPIHESRSTYEVLACAEMYLIEAEYSDIRGASGHRTLIEGWQGGRGFFVQVTPHGLYVRASGSSPTELRLTRQLLTCGAGHESEAALVPLR